MNTDTQTKPKRGRPTAAATWLRLEDVEQITGLSVDVLTRLLERVPNVIPGAIREDHGWEVPERGLRSILGGRIQQYATVAEVAESMRVSIKTVYRWLTVRNADGSLMLPCREVLGAKLIPTQALMSLPARMPGPRPSFFSKPGGASS